MDNEYDKRLDSILDKINSNGIDSLSKIERDFLDAHHEGKEQEIYKNLISDDNERTFYDDDGKFKFILEVTSVYGNNTYHTGILECPDYIIGYDTIPGRIRGRIVILGNGKTYPEFTHDESGLDVWDFCEGLEYELDNFIDYVVSELANRK